MGNVCLIFAAYDRLYRITLYRSTHNTRIERLWLETGRHFARAWRAFFTRLERLHRLDRDDPHQIWLLQTLFLDDIQHDCNEFQNEWNSHPLSGKGQGMSPNVRAVDRYIYPIPDAENALTVRIFASLVKVNMVSIPMRLMALTQTFYTATTVPPNMADIGHPPLIQLIPTMMSLVLLTLIQNLTAGLHLALAPQSLTPGLTLRSIQNAVAVMARVQMRGQKVETV